MNLLIKVRTDARIRARAIGVSTFLLALLVELTAMPDRAGGHGTPVAILFVGVVYGLLTGLTAAGLVVIYRASRIINFAHTAIGVAGATLTFHLLQFTPVPFLVAVPLGVVLAGITGLIFELLFVRRFFHAPRLVLTVLTIAAAGFLVGFAGPVIDGLPFFPKSSDRTAEQIRAGADLRGHVPFRGFHFTIGHLPVQFGFLELFTIGCAVAALIAVGVFFARSRVGTAIRAMSENVERATLLGIGVGWLSSIVWILAGMLAGLGVVLTGFLSSPSAATGIAPDVLLPALAAAVLARMTSLTTAVVAGIGISMLTQSWSYGFPDDGDLVTVGLFAVVTVGLLLQRRNLMRSEDSGASSWAATEEQRAIPKELQAVTGLRVARYSIIAVLLAAVVMFPFLASTGLVDLGAVIALFTIVALSLVVLTGWTGQVSLGQFAFVAIGAAVAGSLTARAGLSFWLAVPIATAISAAIAALVGVPALRVKGLFLGVATFAFAIAVSLVLFDTRYFGWMLPSGVVSRPTLFGLSFDGEKAMYFLCLFFLVAAVLFVVQLRRTRFGRILIALRESEPNVQSFGIDVVRAKILAFAISGGLAGFAGAVFVHQQRGLSAASFTAQASINVFMLAVVGGVGSVVGALLGSAYFSGTTYFVTSPLWLSLLGPGFTLLLLYAEPGGLIAIVGRVRDAVLRIVAQRRQLVVPSLFADYDPEALARRLVTLAAPREQVAPGRDYVLRSELYDDESRYAEEVGGARAREASLLAAAAKSAGETS